MKRQFSLTARLTILFAAISAALLAIVAVVTLSAIERHFALMDQEELDGKFELVSRDIATVHNPAALTMLPSRLQDALIGHPHLLISIAAPDGKLLFAKGSQEIPASYLESSPAMFEWQGAHGHFRGLVRNVATAMSSPNSLTVAIALDTAVHDHFLARFTKTIILVVLVVTLVSGVLGWLAARKGLAPLEAMKTQAAGVTARKLDLRLPVESVPVEMADLSATLNAMLERLEQAFQRLSDFSSDLAHELRTPISNLMMQTQVALSQARSNEAYRDILASNAEEFERLSRIISDMLFLAKADHGLMLPSQSSIDLCTEVRDLFDFYDALGEAQGVSFVCTGSGAISGDRLMVRRALGNLLSNALRHTSSGGRIEITIDSYKDGVSLAVANPGIPIPANHLARIFERFYRVDDSRTHDDTAGSGLGLAIVKAIVTAHGGEVKAFSDVTSTRFVMSFPRLNGSHETN